jgi:aromatic-L-amino-acid/L-tryptophan decarboxylase
MTPDEFRRYGHQLVDWLADFRTTIGQRPVMAATRPGDVKAGLPTSPPHDAEDFAEVIADLDRRIVPGLTHWNHPKFFGYFPANSDLSSALADLVGTGLGTLGLAWQAAPALTEVEEVTSDWVRQMVGLSDAWHGVIQDTASASNLIALFCARERSTDYALARGGLQTQAPPLVVYTSEQSHSSVEKAALLAGFGRDYVRKIACDSAYAIRPDALAEQIELDRSAGLLPCAIVLTTGTTASTAVDPIEPVATLSRRHQLWLHVDAAMAGSAMILPECRWMWEGIEGADSIVFDPHKWLGAAFDCSLFYVRDPEHLIRVLSTSPSYLQTAADGRVKNYRDWGIALGRRFRALKLWFLIRSQGVAGLQARLRRDLDNAQWFARQVAAEPQWRVVAPVVLQTVCIRHEPPGLAGDDLDTHTRSWVERVNRSGKAYLTPSMLGGRWMARVSIGALPTERGDVETLWAILKEAAPPGDVR